MSRHQHHEQRGIIKRIGQHTPYKPPAPSRAELEQARLELQQRQEFYDALMVKALATTGIICYDPHEGTWRAKDYPIISRGDRVTKEEAQARLEDCKEGLIFDGQLGTGRSLTPQEQLEHLLEGKVPILRPSQDNQLVSTPFAGGPPTEVI